MMSQRVLAIMLCILAAGCASTPGDYPSLAIRDAERVSGTLQPAEPYVPAPIDAATLASVEGLVQQANAAYAAYRGKLERVRATALRARGASVGSDAWAAASVALAELETERSRTMVALADLDRLYVAAATEGAATAELANAQNTVNEMVEFETAQINEIHATLR